MNPRYYHKHTPPQRVSTRVRCPVCHEEVYSLAGIHPQCAVRQSDPPKVKNKPAKAPAEVSSVPAAIQAPGADVLPGTPAALRIFQP